MADGRARRPAVRLTVRPVEHLADLAREALGVVGEAGRAGNLDFDFDGQACKRCGQYCARDEETRLTVGAKPGGATHAMAV